MVARAPLVRRRRLPHPLLFLAGCFVMGCAGGRMRTGDRLLNAGDFESAIAAYRAEEALSPTDPVIQRNLGIALLRADRLDEARVALSGARALAPRDAKTHYFLGRAAELQGKSSDAAEAYGACVELGGPLTRAARHHLRELSREQARAEVRSALELERRLQLGLPGENTIAVPDFSNLTGQSDLAPLSRGLAVMMTTDLSKVEQFRVVERQRLQVLLDEMAAGTRVDAQPSASDEAAWAPIETPLGLKQRLAALRRPESDAPYFTGELIDSPSDALSEAVREFQRDRGLRADGIPGPKTFAAVVAQWKSQQEDETQKPPVAEVAATAGGVDPKTAPRVGRLLGARSLVQGSFVAVGTRDIQLQADLVDVISAERSELGAPTSGPLDRVLRLEKELVYRTLDALGIEPTEDERRAIDRLPTESFEAFLLYCRGIELEESGDFDGALQAYQGALAADPGFTSAASAESSVPVDETTADATEDAAVGDAAEEQPPATGDDLVRDLLGSVGDGPAPDEGGDDDAPDDPTDGNDVGPTDDTKIPTPTGTIPTFPDPPGVAPR